MMFILTSIILFGDKSLFAEGVVSCKGHITKMSNTAGSQPFAVRHTNGRIPTGKIRGQSDHFYHSTKISQKNFKMGSEIPL